MSPLRHAPGRPGPPDRRSLASGRAVFYGLLVTASIASIFAGCTPSKLRSVNDASSFIDSDATLIAFSVSGESPFAVETLYLELLDAQGGIVESKQVRALAAGEDAALFLYRVPASGVRFGRVRFKYAARHWETTGPGPEIPLAPGEVTYLGRIQLYSVLVDRYVDSGNRFPAAVRLTFTDGAAEDMPRLAARLAPSPDSRIHKEIPAAWSESGFVALRPWSKSYRTSFSDRVDSWGGLRPVGPELPASTRRQR